MNKRAIVLQAAAVLLAITQPVKADLGGPLILPTKPDAYAFIAGGFFIALVAYLSIKQLSRLKKNA